MIFKEKDPREKVRETSIVTKMLLSAFFYTVIPLLITGVLIIYTYQSLVVDVLIERELEFDEEITKSLSLAFQEAKIQALLTLFIVIVLTLFSNILISRNLTRPLKKLLKGTNEIAKGNLDFKIEIESEDELGKLSAQFNEMTQQLKETKINLEKSKTGLKVEVEERTKELQEKLQELENFQKFVVGREIKMMELKKEIKRLEKELEKKTIAG